MASWWSIWLLMLVGKDRVLNSHSLHRGREDSSIFWLSRQYPNTPAPSCLSCVPKWDPVPQEKISWWVCYCSSSLDLVIWDDICVIRAIIAMGSRKGLSLSAHGGKLGSTRVVNHLHVLTHVLRQVFVCHQKGSVSWRVQFFPWFWFPSHYLFI